MRTALLIVAIVATFSSRSSAQGRSPRESAGEDADLSKQATQPFLTRVFKEILRPEQHTALGSEPTPELLASVMETQQKEAARVALKESEKAARSDQLPEFRRGYTLLGATADILRVDLRSKGLLPEDSSAKSKAASTAYEQGRVDDAMRLAAEALAVNPDDQAATAIIKLAKPKLDSAEIHRHDPFATSFAKGAAVASYPFGRRPGSHVATPQAEAFMRQAIAARKAGDLDTTLKAALAAMRADPTSPTVQSLYQVVIADRGKQMRRLSGVVGLLEQAVEAEHAGNIKQALALAQQAAAIDPNPVIQDFVQDLEAKPALAASPKSLQAPPKHDLPWWPVGAGLGLGLAAFRVVRPRSAWSPQESEPEAPEEADSERIQRNRHRLKVAVTSAAIGFSIVYGGSRLARSVGPTLAATWRAGLGSFQRVAASETGAVNPPAAQRGAASLQNLNMQLTAEEIAGGHAFDKHALELVQLQTDV